jgi:hypothetical protein
MMLDIGSFGVEILEILSRNIYVFLITFRWLLVTIGRLLLVICNIVVNWFVEQNFAN